MKKLISVLLCLLLLAATPLSALAAQGDIIVGRSEDGMLKYGISTSVAAGDALYMMFYEGDKTTNIGVHRVGETEMTLYPIEIGEPITDEDTYAQYKLLADGDVPLVLRQVSCYKEGKESTKVELYEISLEGGIAIATLRCEPNWDVSAVRRGITTMWKASRRRVAMR